ncbi:hypothetical protein [Streptomyces naganishii]|nr:hypothetical protein [Streptomyces naganishii]
MLRIRHTVALAPVPRPWLIDALEVIRTQVEQTEADGKRLLLPDGRPLKDVRLAEGRHLRPGAVYVVGEPDDATAEKDGTRTRTAAEVEPAATARNAPVRITIGQWDRRRAVRLEVSLTDADTHVTADIALTSPDRPRLVEARGRVRTAGGAARGRARVRLDDWWSAAEGGRTSPTAPATARLDHRLLRAELRAAPRPGPDGESWQAHITISLRGRSLLRPLAAVVLAVTGRWTRRAILRELDNSAERWNTTVPSLTAMDAEHLRRALSSGAR